MSSDHGERTLLDKFAPDRQFVLTEHLVIEAPAAVTFAAVEHLRGGNPESPTLRVLTRTRVVPARPRQQGPAFEEILRGAPWVSLGERPGREIAFGAAGRFWTPLPIWHEITADGFAHYQRPRSGTIALSFAVLPYQRRQSLLTFETRMCVADPVSRRWAELHWHSIKPAARTVARQLLHAVNDEATGGRRYARN
ncbi:hypothetical protein [Amycolatopsis sp. GM8]|uniref:hypothetical protein n=1 Tax=Amycolatopsis sp. GM8 TaxID=2896530 RepID=UPI001F1E7E9B|nr:hypothetical protein [Amycolatopsis sp. GM8]